MVFDTNTRWIWDAGDTKPRNIFLNFRRTFDLSTIPAAAPLHISADARYYLYVNGVRLGYGPARGYPYRYHYDNYDIAEHLRIGKNVVAVMVNHWGEGTFHQLVVRGGLLLQIDMDDIIVSDARWRVRRNTAYRQNTPRISIQLPWEEQFDARLADGWTDSDYDDAEWDSAVEIPPADVPWSGLTARRVPLLGNEPIQPTSITDTGIVRLPALILAGHLHPYILGADNTAVGIGTVDALLVTRLQASVSGTIVLKKRANYGGLPTVYLDGQKLTWESGQIEPQALISLTAGEHLLLLDWKGMIFETDFAISLAGSSDLQLRAGLASEDRGWQVSVNPSDDERQAALAATHSELLPPTLHWTVMQPLDVPEIDVQRFVMSSEPLEHTSAAVSLPLVVSVKAPQHGQQFIFDFGREVLGWIEFDVDAPPGAILDFVGFEIMQSQAPGYSLGVDNSFRYICRAGRQTYRSIFRRGFRYLLLSVYAADQPVTIHRVTLHQATYDQPVIGRFQCSDPRLNQIWDMCAYAERLCSDDVFSADGAYEQALWVGDAYAQQLIHQVIYSDPSLPENTLRVVADSLRRTPIVNSQVPSAWENRLMPNWSWLWAIGCYMHYFFNADSKFAQEIYPALAQQAEFALARCKAHRLGLFSLEGCWHFLDWSDIDGVDFNDQRKLAFTHENCLLVAALRATAKMALVVGKSADAQRWNLFAAHLSVAINQHLWSEKLQAYVDSIDEDGQLSAKISQAVNVAALFSGVPTNERAAQLLPAVIVPPQHWIHIGSPFMLSFSLELLVREGRFDELLQVIRARWGIMLDRGATATWETFSNPRSWCHAWSATPAYFLSAHILGVSPIEVGYTRIRIAPQPGDLTWARGTVPTPFGKLDVEWRVGGQYLYLEYKAPEGCEIEVICPLGLEFKRITDAI
ncbi:MAG: family 78 glycoside hydrolase catalytic domain [Anaerolineae bacterium]|nr:family 78 glycoside hydrolase catalytic domain [Anaerolineae bacterium]